MAPLPPLPTTTLDHSREAIYPAQPSSLLPYSSPSMYSIPSWRRQSRDSLLSSTTPRSPEYLARPLILPLPPTPVVPLVHDSAIAHPVFVIETCSASSTIQRPPPLPYYPYSAYIVPSWRDSSVTLFEEDIQPVGLGIWTDVDREAGYSGASVHPATTT